MGLTIEVEITYSRLITSSFQNTLATELGFSWGVKARLANSLSIGTEYLAIIRMLCFQTRNLNLRAEHAEHGRFCRCKL
jgi:hypothetical protein